MKASKKFESRNLEWKLTLKVLQLTALEKKTAQKLQIQRDTEECWKR